MADFVVLWTVRIALALYVAALLLRFRVVGRVSDPSQVSPHLNSVSCAAAGDGPAIRVAKTARLAWTAGFVAFLLHLAAAFHFVHHWSHAAAFEETARRTYEVVGMEVGDGVYVNYLYTLIWGMDVAWWWLGPASYCRRSRWIEGSIQAFLGFIVFNSTVVFGRGLIRWVGWAACLMLVVALGISRRHR